MSALDERVALTSSKLIDHIERVDLRVRDIELALTFYRDVLGLEVAGKHEHHAELKSPGGSVFLMLDSTGVTQRSDRNATGLFHVAIRFPTRAAVGDVLQRLVYAGWAVGAGDHLVSEALYVDDLDGNGIELYRDRPVEEWPPPSGGMTVPMATLPVDLDALLASGRGTAALGEPVAAGTDIGHVHFQVADVERTTRFYADVIGLDLIARMGDQASFFSSNAYHHHIGANSWSSRGARPSPRSCAGLEQVIFGASTVEQLERLIERLSRGGAAHTVEDGRVQVRDPDGITLGFVVRP